MSVLRWWRLARYSVSDRIIHALAAGHQHALPIMRAYGIHSGALYPELLRLETSGMIVSAWDSSTPRRRTYALSPWAAQATLRIPEINARWDALTALTRQCEHCHERHATIEAHGDWFCQICWQEVLG